MGFFPANFYSFRKTIFLAVPWNKLSVKQEALKALGLLITAHVPFSVVQLLTLGTFST